MSVQEAEPTIDLTDGQLSDFKALVASISSLANVPMPKYYGDRIRQARLSESSVPAVYDEFVANYTAAYILTLVGGKLRDPFPQVASQSTDINRLREMGWRRMILAPPDKIGIFGALESAQSIDQNKGDSSIDDSTAEAGWNLTYNFEVPAGEGWAYEEFSVTQSMIYYLREKSRIAAASRTVYVHNSIDARPYIWYTSRGQENRNIYISKEAFLGLGEMMARHVDLAKIGNTSDVASQTS